MLLYIKSQITKLRQQPIIVVHIALLVAPNSLRQHLIRPS